MSDSNLFARATPLGRRPTSRRIEFSAYMVEAGGFTAFYDVTRVARISRLGVQIRGPSGSKGEMIVCTMTPLILQVNATPWEMCGL